MKDKQVFIRDELTQMTISNSWGHSCSKDADPAPQCSQRQLKGGSPHPDSLPSTGQVCTFNHAQQAWSQLQVHRQIHRYIHNKKIYLWLPFSFVNLGIYILILVGQILHLHTEIQLVDKRMHLYRVSHIANHILVRAL